MVLKKIAAFFLGLTALFACEKESKHALHLTQNGPLVIECLLTNEIKYHNLQISSPNDNSTLLPIEDAQVTLSSPMGNISFEYVSEEKKYRSDIPFGIVVNTEYTLTVSHQNTSYSASAIAVPVLPIIPLTYAATPDSLYSINWINEPYDSTAALYEISIDWSFLPGYDTLPFTKTKALLYSYALNSIDVQQVFAPEKEKIKFPKGSIILETKYSLSAQHAKYLRALLLETSWNGGLFDGQHRNPSSNWTENALGFFGCSMITRDSLVVE